MIGRTTVLFGGRVYSSADSSATAIAVAGEVVAWVGRDAAARKRFPDAEFVDLQGAFVTPAFVDAHVHVTASGLLLEGLDLTGAASAAECLALLAAQVCARPGMLVWGHGWDETRWPERRPPSRAELDAVADGTPVYLTRVDLHSALVSSALVDRAPQARTSAGWSAAGPVCQAAHHAVRAAALSLVDGNRRRAAQRALLRHAASRGVAAVHECAGPDISGAEDLADLRRVAATGGLPEVVGYWAELTDPRLAARLGVAGLAGDLFIDGSLGSRTAALIAPYTDDPGNTGVAYLSATQVAEHLVACTQAGIQAGFHVIGDAAVATVVAGFAAAERVVGTAALASRRHRLEHLEMVSVAQARQLGGWGVVASVQPAFDAAWGGTTGMYARRLGSARGSRLNPFADLIAAGVTLAFGSDCPVTPIDPWSSVRAAVHHRTEESAIPARVAFDAHTRAGWLAAGATGPVGTLVPGAPATYAVWRTAEPIGVDSADGLPSVAPNAKLPTCLATVSRGETIYRRDGEGSVR